MKKILATLLALAIGVSAFADRTVQSLDFNWYFHKGDVKEGQSELVDYSDWRIVDVPHDFSIEGPYQDNIPGWKQMGFLPGGIGWYKKEIEWNPEWKSKKVFLEFDGVFMNSTVWVNGKKVGFRPTGYLTLSYEISKYLKEGTNVVTVKADNSLQPAARWYTGSGIYRPVRLVVTGPVYIPLNGAYVRTTNVERSKATVHVSLDVNNSLSKDVEARVNFIIREQGEEKARRSQKLTLKPGITTLEQDITFSNVNLWSPDTPNLYSLEAEIAGRDSYKVNFGIKTISYNVKDGFLLNGNSIKMKGVCIHQDISPAGSAVYPDMMRRYLKMLKDMGCNAIRPSHNPYSPEFYDLCDEMGFMVMDEIFDGWYHWDNYRKAEYDYGYYFLDWWEKDIEDYIKRDRNHACIVMWSLGNEVWDWEKHTDLQKQLNDKFHQLAPGIPTTQAWALGEYLDIAGFNANGEGFGDIDKFHAEQPDKVAVGTEHPHTRSTRGVYRTIGAIAPWNKLNRIKPADAAKYYQLDDYTEEEVFPEFDTRYASSYDNHTRKISIREAWKLVRDNPYFIGAFRWTAFDYLGESFGDAARTNNYGVVDLAGFPKDPFYLYQSLWSDKPMVHLLPHWNWSGKEGVVIPVIAYTNCDEVELFFGKKSLGRKKLDPAELQIRWDVPYKEGELKAVAYKDGRKVCADLVATSGEPKAISLTPDRTTMTANRKDIVFLTVDIVDSKGRFVPTASNLVEYQIKGPYTLIGVENGDILDWSPQQSLSSKAFMGKTLLVLKAKGEPGDIVVTAKSEGLRSAKVTIKVQSLP